ncbi:hypothetical protein [Maridesulfovibrio bastinii]|uniref:hypothetical protein n=1 Tax=Maridesulfovibrio bastinii TaxID=47157 RepID=UPI000408A265|nr:hypothetical protein [Maridesulfovibrio bastinii]
MPVLIYKKGEKTKEPLHLSVGYLSKEYSFTEENSFALYVEPDDAKILLEENPLMFREGEDIDHLNGESEPAEGPSVAELIAEVNATTRHAELDAIAEELGMDKFKDDAKVDEKKTAIIDHLNGESE